MNQKYYIDNIKYEKEEYFNKKRSLISDLLQRAETSYSLVKNTGNMVHSEGCSGSGVYSCNDVENGYNISRVDTGRNVMFSDSENLSKLFYDGFHIGDDCSDFYATSCCGVHCSHIYCCVRIMRSSNIFYSYHLDSCSFCLGCIGLKNKSYCILNKQYTKEERYEKVDEIFGRMYLSLDKGGTGDLGEFFPATMNPFYFNDTAACLIDPTFTKEEVIAKGHLRRDEPIKVDIPADANIAKWNELDRFELRSVGTHGNASDNGNDQGISSPPTPSPSERGAAQTEGGFHIDPSILKYIIQDEQGNVYRIVKMEYDFLMKYGLPLPRKHRLDRMKENFSIG